MKEKKLTAEGLWKKYTEAVAFNNRIRLYDEVEENENFFIGS